jgi:hypothetical protein
VVKAYIIIDTFDERILEYVYKWRHVPEMGVL